MTDNFKGLIAKAWKDEAIDLEPGRYLLRRAAHRPGHRHRREEGRRVRRPDRQHPVDPDPRIVLGEVRHHP